MKKYQYVYVLTRAGKLKGIYKTLELAQSVFPGTWTPENNGFRVPEVWDIGDARIVHELVRDTFEDIHL